MNCKVCGNTSAKTSSLSFFRFPKESSKCRDWADHCDLLELFEKHGPLTLYKSFRICSEHFDPKDIVFDGRKKRLLRSAIPQKSKIKKSSSAEQDGKTTSQQLFQNLCRLCAKANENLIEIFGSRGKLRDLEKKLKYFPQTISETDILPLQICNECESKVNQFYNFIMECNKAETKLRVMLQLKDWKTSNQHKKLVVEKEKIVCNSGTEASLNKTPKNNDSLHPVNCLPESVRPNYNGQVPEENFIYRNNLDCLSRVALANIALEENLNNHTNFIKEVDFIRAVSFEQNYSNFVPINQLQSEPKMQAPTDQNFVEMTKFSCDNFNNSEALNSHSVMLNKEYMSGAEDRAYCGRLQLDENHSIEDNRTRVSDLRFHEVTFLDAQNPCNTSQDLNRNNQILLEPVTNTQWQHLIQFNPVQPVIIYELKPYSEVEGQGHQIQKSFKEEKVSFQRKKAEKDTLRCEKCRKLFRSKASLRQHRAVHSDKRAHTCQECGMSFKRKDTLCNHVRIHTGERPFVCKVCGFAFKQRGDCIKHEKNHETADNYL